MSTKNLYDFYCYYKLIINDAQFFIDEPGDWDKIQITNERDKQYFGFNEQYVDDKVQLKFGGDKRVKQGAITIYPALPLIKNAYDTYGSDFQITFEFGYVLNNVQNVQFSGILNLNTYYLDVDAGSVNCSVEKMHFNDLFRTRTDTPIALNGAFSIDFVPITPCTPVTLTLNSKAIVKQYVAEVTTPESAESGEIARFCSVQPDNSNEVVTELEQGEGLPLGISGIDPRDEFRFFFQASEAGQYNIAFVCSFLWTVIGFPVGSWYLTPRFMIQRSATAKATATTTGGQISGGAITSAVITAPGAGYTYANVTITGDGVGAEAIAVIVAGQVVSITITNQGAGYTNAVVAIDGDGAGATATITDSTLDTITITKPGAGYTTATVNITGDGTGATATATITAGQITAINITSPGTGYTFAFVEIDGDPSVATVDYTAFPDFTISGNHAALSPPQVSAQMNFNMNITRTLEQGDMLYLDFTGTMEHPGTSYYYFVNNYTSNLKITGQTVAPTSTCLAYKLFDALKYLLTAATNMEDSLVSDLLDEGGRGSDYYITNGFQLRGFDTSFKPVVTNINDCLDSLCCIFGAGYGFTTRAGADKMLVQQISDFFKNIQIGSIEDVYQYHREHAKELVYNEFDVGYENYPNPSTGNGQGSVLDEFNAYHKYQLPITTYKSTLSKKAKYVGAGLALENQRREQFKSSPSSSLTDDDSIFIINAKEIDGVLTSEGAEDFDSVSGTLDTVTPINLRISPGRMFYNWAPYVSMSLNKKPGTAFIANSFVQYNNTLQSKLKATDPYNQYEPANGVSEGAGVTFDVYSSGNGKPIHQPIFDYFKAKIKYDQVISIVNYLSFNTGDPQDGGWISYPDNNGEYWKGFIYSIKYNPKTEEADFQVGVIGTY